MATFIPSLARSCWIISSHLLASLTSRIGDDGELDRVAAVVAENSVFQMKSVRPEEFEGRRGIEGLRNQPLLEPQLIRRRYRTRRRSGMAPIDDPAQIGAVDRQRYRSPKTCRIGTILW